VERLSNRLVQLDERHGDVLERAHKDMAMMTEELTTLKKLNAVYEATGSTRAKTGADRIARGGESQFSARKVAAELAGDEFTVERTRAELAVERDLANSNYGESMHTNEGMPYKSSSPVRDQQAKGEEVMLQRRVKSLEHELKGTRTSLHRCSEEKSKLEAQVRTLTGEIQRSPNIQSLRQKLSSLGGLGEQGQGYVNVPAVGLAHDMVTIDTRSRTTPGMRSGIGW